MKHIAALMTFVLLALTGQTLLAGNADDKPSWVSRGVDRLNQERSNDTYSFHRFDTHDPDLSMLVRDHADVLRGYVENNLGARPGTVTVSAVPSDSTAYMVRFCTASSENDWVEARLIDTYYEFDDYDETNFEFEYYQLYAVSALNTVPQFDDWHITKTYNEGAMTMSLVPGMGQIYKGQYTKAYLIIGFEAAFVAGAIYFDYRRHDCRKHIGENSSFDGSWDKKATSWQTMRNLSIGMAVGLYIYNLLDARYAKGVPQVVIDKRTDSRIGVLPFASSDGAGLSFAMRF